MAKINYNSESREWYLASGTILLVTLLCYSFLNFYVLTEESEILSTVTSVILEDINYSENTGFT